MWEAFVEVKPGDRPIDVLKHLVVPYLTVRAPSRSIGWYCFLFHDKASGCLPPEAPAEAYVHVRIQFKGDGDLDDDGEKALSAVSQTILFPDHFQFWRRVPVDDKIAGLDLRDLGDDKSHALEIAWQLIGAQSAVFAEILMAHRYISFRQLAQFLHHWDNMAQREVKYWPRGWWREMLGMPLWIWMLYAVAWGMVAGLALIGALPR